MTAYEFDVLQKALYARVSVRSPVIRAGLVDFWLTPEVEHSFAFMESRPFVAILIHRWYFKTATIQLGHFISYYIYQLSPPSQR